MSNNTKGTKTSQRDQQSTGGAPFCSQVNNTQGQTVIPQLKITRPAPRAENRRVVVQDADITVVPKEKR